MGLFSKKKTEEKNQEETKVVDKKVEVSDKKKTNDVEISGDNSGVVVSPIVTEKSHVMSQVGKYLFKVSSKANKKEIKRVVEGMYGVNVDKVNVLTVSNKKRTIKYDRGYQKAYKKAIVTLKEGQRIAAFEGV